MSASPLGFCAAPLRCSTSLLAADPDLAGGPEGSGFIQGDAHLE